MIRQFLVLLFVSLTMASIAQIQVDSLIAKTSIKLSGKRVTGISNDISFANADSNKLLTEYAAKNLGFVKVVSQSPTASLTGGVSQERIATGATLLIHLTGVQAGKALVQTY